LMLIATTFATMIPRNPETAAQAVAEVQAA
jgi:hypothetical protein